MYNHLPKVDPTRSLDGGRRAREREDAALWRLHREHVAATRAPGEEPPAATPLTRRILTGPRAILGLVGMRR